jgi:NAD-dependent DNA ligase
MTENYKNLKTTEIVKLLKQADEAYFNKGEVIMTDIEYDQLKDYLKEKAPKNPYFKHVGYKPPEKLKVKLPYFLGSQDKIKFENNKKELTSWISKYYKPLEYVISEKLDGISCLITSNEDGIKIYTRGDGTYGIDITKIKDYIKTIPKSIPVGLAIRGELLLSKSNWEKVKHYGANARNLVSGVINSKTINTNILPYIDFVVYDLLSERIENNEALKKVSLLGFKVVNHLLLRESLTNDKLLELLKKFRVNSDYEIDGIVITHNAKYKIIEKKNPEYSFAFKSNTLLEEIEVRVIDVEWNISKDKYLKPIVKFNPINLDGVVIKQATGFNADFIVKNKIGFGSIITIQRSGGVIPDITSVLKPADNGEPIMPKVAYKWNKTKIDIIADLDSKNREHDIKSFGFFMKTLNIKGVGDGIITKLYDNSYDTLAKIIHIKKEDVLKIDGFKEKSSQNLIDALNEVKNKDCKDIMIASNLLGRGIGKSKLDLILSKYPFVCENKKKALELTETQIKEIAGMGDVSAKQFIENLFKFYEFYEELGMELKTTEKPIIVVVNKKLENKHFVFTGFRNKEFEEIIKNNGGFVDETITKNTNYLIIKDKTKITEKVKKAEEKGVIIITAEDFEMIYKD